MRRLIRIIETYSQENGYLRNYMRDGKFDPYAQWTLVCQWIEDNDLLEELQPYIDDEDEELTSADDLEDYDPELFYKLPEHDQKACGEWVVDYLREHDPAEAPTWAHMSLDNKQLLPRDTWLVHFTDDPDGIAHRGFTMGMSDIDKLGLTTWFKNSSFEKGSGGYNFAFKASSRDADWVASRKKYGRDAVMFQNSGVSAFHYGDEEHQIIFHGKDVDPRGIVVLRRDESEFIVKGRKPGPSGRYRDEVDLFRGDFDACVKWVIQNFNQYRKLLTRW